jgi:lipopolysaccharide transport system permease protein
MTLIQSLSLIHTQAVMKLKSKANVLVLSYLWWILEPLLLALMFYVVFKYFRNHSSENYFTFLFTGKVAFLWFSKSVSTAANSLISNRGLIFQRRIPKIVFPMADVQETFYKQIFVFVVLLLLLVLNGYTEYAYWWQIFGLIALQYILICGVSFIFAIFVTYVPDFKILIQMLMMGLMFSSGIFFDINTIPDPHIKELLLTYNPLALLIDGYRQVLMYGNVIDWQVFLPSLAISLTAFFSGMLSLFVLSNKLTRRLLA